MSEPPTLLRTVQHTHDRLHELPWRLRQPNVFSLHYFETLKTHAGADDRQPSREGFQHFETSAGAVKDGHHHQTGPLQETPDIRDVSVIVNTRLAHPVDQRRFSLRSHYIKADSRTTLAQLWPDLIQQEPESDDIGWMT